MTGINESGIDRLGDHLMLCNVSVANLPLDQVIPAAAAAGFGSISVLARAHRRAVTRGGLTNADLRTLLADNDIVVQEVEAVGDWLGAVEPAAEAWMDAVYDGDQLFDLANELGAATIVATHFGAPAPLDDAAAAFARLCDRAAANGQRVALEFPAMATVGDVRSAWAIVSTAGRANGGILFDLWHHRRSGATDVDLEAVPADRIFSIQVCDAARDQVGTLIEDIVLRTLPGDGELGVVPMLREMDARGVRCPVGIEVLRREIVEGGAFAAARTLHRSLASAISAARDVAV